MQLDWAIHTSLIQKRLSHSSQSKQHTCFYNFLWHRITIVALMLQLIWYYRISWVNTIDDLVLVLTFSFKVIKCGWFCMLRIIASNFLKIGNGWTTVEK